MRYPVLLVASLASTSAMLVGCNKSDSNAQQAAAAQQMPPTVVNVMPVRLQSIPLTKQLSGKIVAYQEATVMPQVSGVIDKQLFREGSFVKQGQPLYQINADNYSSVLKGSQADLERSVASVNTAKANYNNAVASLESRKAELQLAKKNLARLQQLRNTNAISKQEYDIGETQVQTAQAAVNNAIAQIGVAKANIDAAVAASRGAQQVINSNQLNINRTIVKAPISGVTSRSSVDVGTLATAGQTQLITISQLNPVYVDISQSSSELLELRQQLGNGDVSSVDNAQVQVRLPDGTVYPQIGQLSFREARVDPNTNTVNLRAVMRNDNGVLLPGMLVNTEILQGMVNNAILLPASAVTRTPKGGSTVNIVDSNSKIQVRPVTVSGNYQGQWVVTGGLKQGENVVIIGGAKVKPDQQVVVKPYVAEAANTANPKAVQNGSTAANRAVSSSATRPASGTSQ